MRQIFHEGVGRKFVACMSVQFCNMVLLYFGKLTDGSYLTLTMFLMGGYVAGNIANKMVNNQAAGG